MKHVANWALNRAVAQAATYADVRVIAQRSRALSTKNGKVGSASDSESVGMNVRVIVVGARGRGSYRGAGGRNRQGVGTGEEGRCAAVAREACNGGVEYALPDRSVH